MSVEPPLSDDELAAVAEELKSEHGLFTRRDVIAAAAATGSLGVLAKLGIDTTEAAHGTGNIGEPGNPLDTAYVTSISGDGDTVDIGPSVSTSDGTFTNSVTWPDGTTTTTSPGGGGGLPTQIIGESSDADVSYSGDLGADINTAMSNLPTGSGGIVYIEPRSDGSWYTSSTKAVLDKRGTRLVGPGKGVPGMEVNADVIGVETQAAQVIVEGLRVRTSSGIRGSHTSQGIHYGGRTLVRDCWVDAMGDNGIVGTDAYTGNGFWVVRCRSQNNGQNVNTGDVEGNGIACAIAAADVSWTPNNNSGDSNVGIVTAPDANSNNGHGVLLRASAKTVDSGMMQTNGKSGIYNYGSGDCMIMSPWLEGNTDAGLTYDSNSSNNRHHLSGTQTTPVDNGTGNSAL